MYSNYGTDTSSSNFQNFTNGVNFQTAASQYPANMSEFQLSGLYPACGSSQQYPVLSVDGVDTYNIARERLQVEQDHMSCLYDTRRSYANNLDLNQANYVMNYSAGTKVNEVTNNHWTGTAYNNRNAKSCNTGTKINSCGNNLMTSQRPSQLPIQCWTNEELLAAANLSDAEAAALLASVDAELSSKRLKSSAAENGMIFGKSNHSQEISTAGSRRFGSSMQQATSSNNDSDTSSNQLHYDQRVSPPMDINYLPPCQFSNSPNNLYGWSFSNRQTQSPLNVDIRTHSQESQHKMMPEYHFQGLHVGQDRTTTVYNPNKVFPSNSTKQSSPTNYDFSQAFDQGASNYNFSQALEQGVSNYISPQECSQGVSNRTMYPAQTGLKSCPEVIPSLNNWIPTSISSTQAQQRLVPNSATIFAVDQAPVASSRKITSTARDAMKAWFEENKHHPYPDPDEYKNFVAIGGTTYSQAVKWFANRRKRTGTCKTIPEYVQGRRVKPAKPVGERENVVPVNLNRKRTGQTDNDNLVAQPREKKSRKM